MTKTRSMTRNERKRSKTCDDSALESWSYLNPDVLFLVMIQLGIVDYLAFSGVCKSWRNLALSNKNKFFGSKHPMSIFRSIRAKKVWYLDDFEGRKFKTILPKSYGRTCVGLTCSYLIMFGRKTRDFWLVNPITRHQLYFPVFPFCVGVDPRSIKAVLVFSRSLSGWLFVISFRYSHILALCVAGKQTCWNHLVYYSNHSILDVHAFKGKIYTIDSGSKVYEFRLDPSPTLTPLEIKNFSKLNFTFKEFVSSGEKLFVVGRNNFSELDMDTQELDLEKMKWRWSRKTIEEHELFLGYVKCSAAAKPEIWDHPRAPIERITDFPDIDRSRKDRFTSHMWYFPGHDCLNVNLLHE